METQEITIRVPSEAARVYQSVSQKERHKIDIWLSLWLREIIHPLRSHEEIIQEARKHDAYEASEHRKQSEKGWQIFSTFGDDADEGCLQDASEKHDLYLYGKQ